MDTVIMVAILTPKEGKVEAVSPPDRHTTQN
jgi:hypothetical protein